MRLTWLMIKQLVLTLTSSSDQRSGFQRRIQAQRLRGPGFHAVAPHRQLHLLSTVKTKTQTQGTNSHFAVIPPPKRPPGEPSYCKTTDCVLSKVENKVTKMFSEPIFNTFTLVRLFLCVIFKNTCFLKTFIHVYSHVSGFGKFKLTHFSKHHWNTILFFFLNLQIVQHRLNW